MAVFKMSSNMAEALAKLYFGLLKADNKISDEEKDERKLKNILTFYSNDIYFIDGTEGEVILGKMKNMMNDGKYKNVDSAALFDEGCREIEENAGELDDISPIRDTLHALAKLDSLTIHETKYIKRSIDKLNSI